MAAIAGMPQAKGRREAVESMLQIQRHRGPDTAEILSERLFELGVCASAHSTLRGNGLARADGIVLAMDGELYNERRDGESDAHVALRLYREHGRAFASRLNGAFGCALLDGDELILVRDNLGLRPLYWGHVAGGGLGFASEMKALVGRSQDVQELRPGTSFSSVHGLAGYVPATPDVRIPNDPAEAAEALRDCLLRATERRLSDGAVGACLLSGGLDSSIIAAAVKALGGDMKLLTVGADSGAPDVENARAMARHLGFEHEVRLFNAQDVEAALPKAVWHMESFDEDCVSGTLSNLFAAELAGRTTRCVLSGEGADELFGGYHLLKDLASDQARLTMMSRLVEIAYNTALQRLDRSMMAHAIHYRTPFLDPEVIAFAAHLPVQWKIRPMDNGESVEKWILRQAFKALLPVRIAERIKLRFSRGTGTDELMDAMARRQPDGEAFCEENCTTPEGYVLSSPKEAWYYRLFKEQFPDPCFERLVGRWDPNK